MFKIAKFNCCGLDVHKTWIFACIGGTDSNLRTVYYEDRFSSFPKDLRRLATWLQEHGCTDVCMESSGKTPIDVIQDAGDGVISPEQAVKLRECLKHIDELNAHKNSIEKEILELVKPFSAHLTLIRTVPGLDKDPMTAITILSEIGSDMSVFLSAKNLVSWAGCCPRNDNSANMLMSMRIASACSYLKPLLVQVANALIKSKNTLNFLNVIAA